MNKFAVLHLALVCLLPNIVWAESSTRCENNIKITRAAANIITADAATNVRSLDPSFFGFNLEWLEFQSNLWDAKSQHVLPNLISIFKEFPGATYRYPGGTNSNHFDWRDAIGPTTERQPRKHVTWSGPLRAEFGVDEYLQFVKAVDGKAWYVANLFGALDTGKSVTELAGSAGRLAAYAQQRANQGMPAIARWELGNELDRGALKWSPNRIADAALQVGSAIKSNVPQAKFVVLQQEYAAQADKGYTAIRYNKDLRDATRALEPAYAMHFYYDGHPDTPPVEYFLKQLCQVVDNTAAEGSRANIWVTEHGRVPTGFWAKTPKEMWPETANLTAAISMSDMVIALAQIPEAQGAFAHSLVTTNSPWPLVHKRENGSIDPTVTLLGLKLLRQSMQANVIASAQTTATGGAQNAPYAVRSAVLSNNDRSALTLWTINKTGTSQELQFRLKGTNKDLQFINAKSINDEQPNANNYLSAARISIQQDSVVVKPAGIGIWNIQLAPNSINTISFSTQR